MGFDHDFKKFPELTNAQLEVLEMISPHKQIKEDFVAKVIKVYDGDTITLRANFRDFDFKLRFLDIDAPEMNNGGIYARDYLRDRILDKIVKIAINLKNRVDKYGRLLGSVIYQGQDIGHEMLRLGLVQRFENRRESELPNIDKVFSLKQWGLA